MYHSNYPSKAEETKEEQKEIDSETPAYAGTKIKINKNIFHAADTNSQAGVRKRPEKQNICQHSGM